MAYLMNSGTSSTLRKPSQEDLILMLNAPESPIYGSMRKGKKPQGLIHYYNVRTFPDAVVTTVADGTDRTASDAADFESLKSRIGIRPHQRDRTVSTGNLTIELEHQYGIANLHADNIMTAQAAVVRDIENVLGGTQDSALSSNSHTTRGMGCWLGLTTVADSLTIPSGAAVASGAVISLGSNAAASAVTETNLRTMLQSIHDASRKPIPNCRGFVSSALKTAISNLMITATVGDTTASHTVPLRTFSGSTAGNEFGYMADYYKSDFGRVELIVTTELPTGTTDEAKYPYGYFIDPNVWEYLPVEPLHVAHIPQNVGGKTSVVRASFFLKCHAPNRNGVIHWDYEATP